DFARKLRLDRPRLLWSRGAESAVNTGVVTVRESEPNDSVKQALAIGFPAILEGAIARPGDVDYFRFEVKPGEKLAFDVERPGSLPPHFSPRIGIFDTEGKEILTNVYRKIDGDGDDWVKSIEPKTIFEFEKGGEYYLQMRDLTFQHGAAGFRYRVLIR